MKAFLWFRLSPLASLVLVISVALVAACSPLNLAAENETDVRVIDLKFAGAGPFGWVDNETFITTTNTGETYLRKDGATVRVARVTTINYRTGERKLFGKVSSELCYSNGYVSYVFRDRSTDELWISYGVLGEEITLKVEPGKAFFDPRSCKRWSERPAPPAWAVDKVETWTLEPPLGVINCNAVTHFPGNREVKASFHRGQEATGTPLPFSCYDVRRGFTYYPFNNAFFAIEQALVTPWPPGPARKIFWLYADGEVQSVTLPYSSAIRGDMVPTKAGIVAFGRPASRDEEYGVYLVTPRGARRILRGSASGKTSPDGCRVAILHDPDFGARVSNQRALLPVTLRVLEVCAKEALTARRYYRCQT